MGNCMNGLRSSFFEECIEIKRIKMIYQTVDEDR